MSSALLVDDDEDVGPALSRLLEQEGFAVTWVGTAEAAIDLIRAQPLFDLVVTDIYLGTGKDGLAVARAAVERESSQPVILLTGKPTFDNLLASLRAHAVDYLTKPVRAEEFLARARRAVTESRLRRENEFLRQANKFLASVLPNAIEAKDPTTRGHSERVVHYTDKLARLCGVGERERELARLAALLHDVGKIGVPETVLTKNGPLTADERKKIQEHPEIGWRILAPLEGPVEIREWVFQHHERWDGRGYPRQLKGDEVALAGRVLIVAEVYDALATARSYKDAWAVERIADLFELEAGHHFDPDIARMVAEGLRREGRAFLECNGNGSQRTMF